MDLFLKSNLQFEKLSAAVLMPEDPNMWPQEVLQELYKQIPFIHDFNPHVEMLKVDAERGYGFGHISVMPATEAQRGTDPGAMSAAGLKEVKIPVIVKENKLYPLDILITPDSKMFPLTEDRLRAAIFRPQAFDVTSQTPGDQSMIGQLYPPYRQNYGMGGGGVAMNIGMGKEGAANLGNQLSAVKARSMPKPSYDDSDALMVMAAIQPTLNASDVAAFKETLRNHDVKVAYLRNAAASASAVSTILTFEPTKQASVESLVLPTVKQLSKIGSGYSLKTASRHFWDPKEVELNRAQALAKCGSKMVLAADLSGSAMESEEALPPEESTEEPIENTETGAITTFGCYDVISDDGQTLTGYVFPNLIDADGREVPLSLFTDGQNAAVQGDIVGVPSHEQIPLPTGGDPSGYGFFFSVEGTEVRATVPMYLKGSYRGVNPEEPSMHVGETFDGRPLEVSSQPNVQTAVGTPEGKLIIPANWQWLALGSASSVPLQSTESEAPDEEELKEAAASVYVVGSSDGHTFSLRGDAVSKLASEQREFLNTDETLFLLGALGANMKTATQKMGESISGRAPVGIKVAYQLALAPEVREQAKLAAAQYLATVPSLRRNLFKEASVITDPSAVDAVLSIGFLNPSNVEQFIAYLPTLESGLSNLTELLIASRLGLNEVPESALEKCMQSLNEVCAGLKALAFQGSDAYATN